MNERLKRSLTLIAFLFVIVGLSIGVNALVKPIINKNNMQEQIDEYSKVLSDIDRLEELNVNNTNEQIIDQKVAYNADDKVIGYLYKANGTNKWGAITLIAALNDKGNIIKIEAVVDQSMRKDETKAFVESYEGAISDPDVDATTAPTTKDSVDLADELIASISSTHSTILESILYDEYFGVGFTISSPVITVDNDVVIKKQTATIEEEVVGAVYSATITGPYFDEEEGEINFKFILDENNLLKGYIQGDYEHTAGFYKHVKTYLDNLLNKDISKYELYDKNVDGATGATNTVTLVSKLLVEIKGVINND